LLVTSGSISGDPFTSLSGTPYNSNTSGQPGSLFAIPDMPSMWSAIGNLQPYAIPELPQFNYDSLDPTLKASIEKPYMDALGMAREQLGGAGQLGTMGRDTPMFSGAAGQVLGKMAQEAGPTMAQSAYNFTMPNQMQEWQAQLGQNITGYNTGLQALGTDYNAEMQMRNEYLQQLMMPYSILPGMMGGTYSTPVMSEGTNYASALGSGLTGGLLGLSMFSNPLAAIGLGLGGFLGGL